MKKFYISLYNLVVSIFALCLIAECTEFHLEKQIQLSYLNNDISKIQMIGNDKLAAIKSFDSSETVIILGGKDFNTTLS